MKVHVLVDNHAQRKFDAEWGLSLFIETQSGSLLFDYGNTDLFLKNAAKKGLDVLNADHFVVSHGHWDHGNGLVHLPLKEPKIQMVCHPGSFIKRYRGQDYLGLPLPYDELKQKIDFICTDTWHDIMENVFFIGQIPRVTSFENKKTGFTKEDGSMDLVDDDSGIAIKTSKGLVVITGCGHAGVCNTILHAMQQTGEQKIHALLGGFHLKGNDELTNRTIEELKRFNIDHLYPTHCTEFPALVQFANAFGSVPLKSGLTLEFTD
jgi:7,8-dihydropterin-6-yl-methyl-4-(beta-D-ribofuranosyl)aminobenzene 5'-phosphate synthase